MQSTSNSIFNDYNLWEPILKQYLEKRRWFKYYKKIFVILKIINLGIKPAFLWDIGQIPQIEIVKNLLQCLKSKQLINKYIFILCIEDDIFVINKIVLIKLLRDESNFKFVNINSDCVSLNKSNLENLQLFTFLKEHINNLNENFNDIISLQSLKSITQVYGIILGYPVVFCLKVTDNEQNITSLNYVPLVNIKISVNFNGKPNEIYSFSHLPEECLIVHVDNWLNHWKESIGYFKLALDIDNEYLPAYKNLYNLLNESVQRWHFRMLNDNVRNDSFRRAILKKVQKGQNSILDIGTGTGLLSIYAALEGAKNVFACDYSEVMIDIAKNVMNSNKLTKSVILINKLSNDILIPGDIPEKCSLIVTETVDAGLFGEHILQTLIHAWENLLVPKKISNIRNDTIIPYGATLYVTPIQCLKIARMNYILESDRNIPGNILIMDNIKLYSKQTEPYDTENLRILEHNCLANTVKIFNINFNDIIELKEFLNGNKNIENLVIKCKRDGFLDAFAIWFDLHLDKQITISSSPANYSCWDQAIFPLSKSYFVKKDAIINVNIECTNGVLSVKLVNDLANNKENLLEVPQKVISFLNCRSLLNIYQQIIRELPREISSEILDLTPFPINGCWLAKQFNHVNITSIAEINDKVFTAILNENKICKTRFQNINLDKLLISIDQFYSKFDIIFLDFLISTGEFNEDIINSIEEIRKCLKPQGKFIPSQLNICCKLIDSNQLCNESKVINPNLSSEIKLAEHFNEYQVPYILDLNIKEIKYKQLSEDFKMGQLNIDENLYDRKTIFERNIRITENGNFNAIFYWFEYEFLNNIKFSTLSTDSHINHSAWLLNSPINVSVADIVKIRLSYQDCFLYFSVSKQ